MSFIKYVYDVDDKNYLDKACACYFLSNFYFFNK